MGVLVYVYLCVHVCVRALLTAQVCTWAWIRAGCTGWNETHGRLNQRGSLETTAALPLGADGSRCMLGKMQYCHTIDILFTDILFLPVYSCYNATDNRNQLVSWTIIGNMHGHTVEIHLMSWLFNGDSQYVQQIQSWWYKSLGNGTFKLKFGLMFLQTLVQSLTLQEVGDVFELRDVVLAVAAVLLQQREDTVVLVTRVRGIQRFQLPEHSSPCGLLLLRVLHIWDRLTTVDRMGKKGRWDGMNNKLTS